MRMCTCCMRATIGVEIYGCARESKLTLQRCEQVIHMVNSTLPRLSCHTCKNKFHSGTALRFPLLRACLSSLLQAHPIQRATHTRTTKKQTKQENTQTRVDVLGGREHAQMYLSTYALMNTAMPLCTSAPLPALLHLALPPPSLTPLCVPGFLPRAARCCAACLYKWFNTSNKSACPLCQSPWYS